MLGAQAVPGHAGAVDLYQLERECDRSTCTPADCFRKGIGGVEEPVSHPDGDLELSDCEQLREVPQLATIGSHVDARDHDPSLFRRRV